VGSAAVSASAARVAVYVARCHDCGPALPVWQQLLLSVLAVAIALGLLYVVHRLLSRRRRP
jgi:hypothetical protein